VNTTLIDLAAAPAAEMRERLSKMTDVQIRRIFTLAYLGQLERERQRHPLSGAQLLEDLLTKDLPQLEKFISDLRLAIWSDEFARRAQPR
jgi:hypothetical protein